MILRPYQQKSLDDLYHWWVSHTGTDAAPLLVLPTGAGKSVVIAELVRLLFDTWPDQHPRTLVIVPSKELAEQNAEKLVHLVPNHLRIGFYSAAIGRKQADADIIVATIGSIARNAHLLGNIKCVIIDEAHLVNPDGPGQYRQFLNDLGRYCEFRVVGLTATPFRGNGIWLTDGDDPLFTGIAHETPIQELLDAGHLSPLVRPVDLIQTRIDTSDVRTTGGDYNIGQLEETVNRYLSNVVAEAVPLAADRSKWIAFTPTVANAETLVALLRQAGISADLVCGETPKKEREQLVADFRAGRSRCLVTVLALATGFDVPDVDAIIWCRPTISPVLYVQGAGRGMRIAQGKTDCLWLDFSDTTDRMGPVDAIRGRKKGRKRDDQEAPFAVCDNCGNQVRPASALVCPECGTQLREEEAPEARSASNAAIMLHQVAPKVERYSVTKVTYHQHRKEGSPDSLRVEYWSGLRVVAKEWVCFEHQGFARAKAEQWWRSRIIACGGMPYPDTAAEALDIIEREITAVLQTHDYPYLRTPFAIHVNESGKYPEIVKFEWEDIRDNHAAA